MTLHFCYGDRFRGPQVVLGQEVITPTLFGFGEKAGHPSLLWIVCIHDIVVKNVTTETGEMAQQLRALDTFPEDEGLIPSTSVVAHSHL